MSSVDRIVRITEANGTKTDANAIAHLGKPTNRNAERLRLRARKAQGSLEMIRLRIERRRTERPRALGQSIVELGLILPVFLVVCLGILDLGRAFYSYERIQNAAREGAAWLALRPK